MDGLTTFLIGLTGLVSGYAIREFHARLTVGSAKERSSELIEEARRHTDKATADSRRELEEEQLSKRAAFEQEQGEREDKVADQQEKVDKREKDFERRVVVLERKETFIEQTEERIEKAETQLDQRRTRLEDLLAKETRELERISRLSAKEAEKRLLDKLTEEVEAESAAVVEQAIKRSKGEIEQKAQEAIILAIQRLAVEHTADHVVSTVDIPNDDMKGRIIGREGRNIRAFEQATGIDVIIDDTPGLIVVSGFDSLRREVARRSMEKLTIDGRIHPARIEEVVQSTRNEVEEIIQETGRQVCYESNIHGLHQREITMLGRLKYRTSLGTNVLDHSVEVARLAGMIASELKLDAQLAKRAGLLHDIGKALDHQAEGSHAIAGGDLARRCDESEEVANAIAAHHDEVPPTSPYAILVQLANKISKSRPVRQGNFEEFVQRMEKLEALASDFDGIISAYAIRAGREVRVILDPDQVSDEQATLLCRKVALRIKEEMSYPNELRVTLLRESRVVEYSL